MVKQLQTTLFALLREEADDEKRSPRFFTLSAALSFSSALPRSRCLTVRPPTAQRVMGEPCYSPRRKGQSFSRRLRLWKVTVGLTIRVLRGVGDEITVLQNDFFLRVSFCLVLFWFVYKLSLVALPVPFMLCPSAAKSINYNRTKENSTRV